MRGNITVAPSGNTKYSLMDIQCNITNSRQGNNGSHQLTTKISLVLLTIYGAENIVECCLIKAYNYPEWRAADH